MLSRLAGALEFWTLRRADHVVAQAEAMRERLSDAGRVAFDKISVIYPGLNTSEFTQYSGPPAVIPGLADDAIAIMYVGSTHSYQGLDLLAAAQRYLPDNFTVVLALSSDGSMSEPAVAKYGFEASRTLATAPASSALLPAWLQRANVLVHARPNTTDNINVQSKLGLYLAAGRPIAATAVGDYERLLGSAPGCVLAPPEPRALARAIQAAAEDPEVALGSTQNRKLAEAFFESSSNAMRLKEIYMNIAMRLGHATTEQV